MRMAVHRDPHGNQIPSTPGERRYDWRTSGMEAAEDGNYVLATDLRMAAPEMLAALQAWEHWYSRDSTEFNRDTAREAGIAAIKKAKGSI